jgi:hypothetical protein
MSEKTIAGVFGALGALVLIAGVFLFAGRAFLLAFQDESLEPFIRSPGGLLSYTPSARDKVAKGHRAFAEAWRVAGEMCLNRVVREDPHSRNLRS